MSHTPGPWSISTDREATGVIYALRGFEWDDICAITPRCEAAANAHLIATAPEMLEALETMERLAGTPMMMDDPARVAAQKAIRKARDEE